MTTDTIFSSLSTRVLVITNEFTDKHTLQVFHGGISVAFSQESKIATDFYDTMDKIIDDCMGPLDKDDDVKYARKMISLCRKLCNVHG